MKFIKPTALLMAIFFSVTAYSAQTKLKGVLYLNGGGEEGLIRLDLESRKYEYLGQGGGFAFPAKLDESRFIVEGDGIEIFNVNNKQSDHIAQGSDPLYVPEAKTVFYYKYAKGLFKQNLETGTKEEFVTDNIHTQTFDTQPDVLYYPPPPVLISRNEICYFTKNSTIEIYNLARNSFRVLKSSEGFKPVAFYSKKNALVCDNEKDGALYFFYLADGTKEKLSIKNPEFISNAVIPIPDQDCLIYSKYRGTFFGGEYQDTYVYRVESRKEEKYLLNFEIASGFYAE